MPKTMFILMSHQITQAQQNNAFEQYGIEKFIVLNEPHWSNISPSQECINPSLYLLKKNLSDMACSGDYLLVQGDFGATHIMVNYAKQSGLIPVYATTERISSDRVEGEKIITIREFQHIQFRKYE